MHLLCCAALCCKQARQPSRFTSLLQLARALHAHDLCVDDVEWVDLCIPWVVHPHFAAEPKAQLPCAQLLLALQCCWTPALLARLGARAGSAVRAERRGARGPAFAGAAAAAAAACAPHAEAADHNPAAACAAVLTTARSTPRWRVQRPQSRGRCRCGGRAVSACRCCRASQGHRPCGPRGFGPLLLCGGGGLP